MQLVIYVVGGVATVVAASILIGDLGGAWHTAAAEGKLRVFDWSRSLQPTYTFWSGLVGGALLSAASHGTDHLIVQRLLATRNLSDARRALIGSGILVILQFSLSGDRLYPTFVLQHLPAGLAGLVVAGLLAAAMSTVSSSLNSMASATTHDFYASLTGKRDARHLLTVGRWATLGWAAVLMAGALSIRSTDQPVVEMALAIASITYGALLGTYILGGISRTARQSDAIGAIVVATVAMVLIVLVKPGPFALLAWPWYVPLGTLITLAAGFTPGAVRRLFSRA